MKSFIKNIGLFVAVVIISFLTSVIFGSIYSKYFPSVGGGFFVMSSSAENQIIGFPLAIGFFSTFIFLAFGNHTKKIWAGVTAGLIIVFWAFFDLVSLYVPIILSAIGWILGLGIEKLIKKLQTPDVKAKV